MKLKTVYLAACAAAIFTMPAQAILTAYVSNFTSNTIDISVSGTIDSAATIGTTASNVLYLGHPGNTNWILSDSPSANPSNGGGVTNIANNGEAFSVGAGDFLEIVFANPLEASQVIDFSFNITGGNFEPLAVDVSDMILSAGINPGLTALPDIQTQVGTATVVPEPSTYAALGGLAVLGFAVWRRRSK